MARPPLRCSVCAVGAFLWSNAASGSRRRHSGGMNLPRSPPKRNDEASAWAWRTPGSRHWSRFRDSNSQKGARCGLGDVSQCRRLGRSPRVQRWRHRDRFRLGYSPQMVSPVHRGSTCEPTQCRSGQILLTSVATSRLGCWTRNRTHRRWSSVATFADDPNDSPIH